MVQKTDNRINYRSVADKCCLICKYGNLEGHNKNLVCKLFFIDRTDIREYQEVAVSCICDKFEVNKEI